MVNANPRDNLRACDALLCHVIELLIDVTGFARDAGLNCTESQTQNLTQAATDILADVRKQLVRLAQSGNNEH